MAPHSSTLAWKIPRMEEPGGLQSMGSLRVRHDWATSLSLCTFTHWRRNGNPLQCYAWRIPGTGQPSVLPSLGSHRVRHDWSDLAAAVAVADTVSMLVATRAPQNTHRHVRTQVPVLLLLFSHPVVSHSLWFHELQHARPHCPSPSLEFAQIRVHWVGDAI